MAVRRPMAGIDERPLRVMLDREVDKEVSEFTGGKIVFDAALALADRLSPR